MNKTQFTPGPWKVHELGNKNYFPHVTLGHSRKGKDPRLIINCSHNGNSKSIEANARLIAAAPEMYELLEQIIRWPGNSVPKESIKELLDRITPPVSDNTQTQNKGG